MLQEWLTEWRGEPWRVEVADDYQAVRDAIEEASYEVVWTPPLVCATVTRGLRATLTAVRSGATSSSGALIIRASSNLTALRDLIGRRAAWVDKLSIGGYRGAVALLRQEGYEPDSVFAEQRFLGTYRDAVLAVVAGDADVTSVYAPRDTDEAAIRQNLEELVGADAAKLTVLSRLPAAPYDALVLTERLLDTDAAALESALHALTNSGGPNMLLETCGCDGFARIDPGDYDWLRSAMASYESLFPTHDSMIP